MWWLEEENGTYGASGFLLYIYIYIPEVLGGLYVWVEVWKKLFVHVPTFWKDFRFLFSRVFCDGLVINIDHKINSINTQLTIRIFNSGDYCYIFNKVKLVTVDEGDPKALFSIATTPRCRCGRFSFPWIAPTLPLDTYLIILCIKQRGIKYHFLSLWYDLTLD